MLFSVAFQYLGIRVIKVIVFFKKVIKIVTMKIALTFVGIVKESCC